MLTINVQITTTISDAWLDVPSVSLGAVSSTVGTPNRYVLVKQDAKPHLRFDVCFSMGESSAFEDHLLWSERLILGVGHHVYLVNLESGATLGIDLGSYFGSFWLGEDFVLVSSAERVFKLGADCEMLWKSDRVGIDGVAIDAVSDRTIEGRADWDPPGGWRLFRLALQSGEAQ